jgi:hypothetical protein
MPAFRFSAGRNGEPVPAVRNAAIRTNLQTGTHVCKGCGLSGHRDLVGSINMHEIAFQKQRDAPSIEKCHGFTARYLLLEVPES